MSPFLEKDFLVIEAMTFIVGFLLMRWRVDLFVKVGVIVFSALLVSVPIGLVQSYEARGFEIAGWRVGIIYFLVAIVSEIIGVGVGFVYSWYARRSKKPTGQP